jgi:hypothetical protein
VLWRQRDRVGALEHWAIARDRFSRVGDPAGAASVLHNEASAMLSEEHTAPGIARTLLLEAVRLTAGRPPTRDTGLLHLHLGDAYLRCGEPAPARDEWQRAFNMLTSLGCADAEQAGQRLAGT